MNFAQWSRGTQEKPGTESGHASCQSEAGRSPKVPPSGENPPSTAAQNERARPIQIRLSEIQWIGKSATGRNRLSFGAPGLIRPLDRTPPSHLGYFRALFDGLRPPDHGRSKAARPRAGSTMLDVYGHVIPREDETEAERLDRALRGKL